MANAKFLTRLVSGGSVVVGLLSVSPAFALQPLNEFLAQAESHNFDVREARASAIQREGEAKTALGRILPSFSARGTYTRNQYEVIAAFPTGPAPTDVQRITIQPQDQLDAFLQLDVPIVDIAGYARYKSLASAADAQKAGAEVSLIDARAAVIRTYYQLVGVRALVGSARESVDAAEKNLTAVRDRKQVGLVPELDVERAVANLERSKQDLADADLAVANTARALETLTGLAPSQGGEANLNDDLHDEAPLASWLSKAKSDLPQNRAADELTRAAADGRRAAKLSFLPVLSAQGLERFTNATSFVGRSAYYTLTASLTWRLDYSTFANVSAQTAAADAAQVRAERTARGVQDRVYDAWVRVQAGIAKSRSARAQAKAAQHAAQLAEDRYQSGVSTQLDVVQAQRDAFLAKASMLQADAELVSYRATMRLVVNQPIDK